MGTQGGNAVVGLSAKLGKTVLVCLLQPTDGAITYLTHALTLQLHVVGNLGHSKALLLNAVIGCDNLMLTLGKGSKGIFHRMRNS
jgi:hypothetical protein